LPGPRASRPLFSGFKKENKSGRDARGPGNARAPSRHFGKMAKRTNLLFANEINALPSVTPPRQALFSDTRSATSRGPNVAAKPRNAAAQANAAMWRSGTLQAGCSAAHMRASAATMTAA